MSQYINTPNPGPVVPGGAQRGTQTSGVAITSLILGIISLIGSFMCLGIPGIIGLILGLVALSQIKKSQGMIKGRGMAITGVITSLLGLIGLALFVVYGVMNADLDGEVANDPVRTAERNIGSAKSDGKVGFGNTPEAAAIADNFATRMKTMREALFTGSDTEGFSTTDGKFLTHCELQEGTCAFLVHVPKLRKYEGDAKKQMCDLAWIVAQNALAESDFPEGGKLAVGVRGFALYEQIMIGEFHKDLDKSESSITSRGGDRAALKPFFPEPEVTAGEVIE